MRVTECEVTIVDTSITPYTFNLFKSFKGIVTASGKTDVKVVADYNIERAYETKIKTGFVDIDFINLVESER